MNEELQRRVHEAALAASLAWDLPDSLDERDKHEAVADAVLSVVADWCDERRAAILSGPPTSDSVIEMCVGYTRAGCRSAFADVAGACRPVGEDQT